MYGQRINAPVVSVLAAKAATGASAAIGVNDYQKIGIQFSGTGTCNATTKFAVSLSDTAPDFGSAQSVTNHWDYVDVIDLEDGASIDGDTGIALAGADDFRNLQANCENVKWFAAIVTAHSAGTVTVNIKPSTNG